MSQPISPRKIHRQRTNSYTRTPTSSYPSTPIRNPTFDYISSTTIQLPEEHVSPTKALALSRLQHDISQIQIWLEQLFAPASVPVALLKWREEVIASVSVGFESGVIVASDDEYGRGPAYTGSGRVGSANSDVLDALKTLKQENLAADNVTLLVHDAEVEELRWLRANEELVRKEREDGGSARVLIDQVMSSLSVGGIEALNSMAGSAVEIGLDIDHEVSIDDLTTMFTSKILERAHRTFVLQQQMTELESVQQRLDYGPYCTRSANVLGMGQGDIPYDEQMEHTNFETAQMNRDTKQINLKIMEYEERARGLERQLSKTKVQKIGLQNLLDERHRLEEREMKLKQLQERLDKFNDLPPDLQSSNIELARAVEELDSLRRKRKGLCEKLRSG